MEFLVGTSPVAAFMHGALIRAIATIVFTITNKCSRNAFAIVALEDVRALTDSPSICISAVRMGFIPGTFSTIVITIADPSFWNASPTRTSGIMLGALLIHTK